MFNIMALAVSKHAEKRGIGKALMTGVEEEIIQESKRLGIDKIGFTTAEPFDSLKESLEEQKAAGHTSG
ncbi:N-acetyltransferase, partial [Enterococcus faecium]